MRIALSVLLPLTMTVKLQRQRDELGGGCPGGNQGEQFWGAKLTKVLFRYQDVCKCEIWQQRISGICYDLIYCIIYFVPHYQWWYLRRVSPLGFTIDSIDSKFTVLCMVACIILTRDWYNSVCPSVRYVPVLCLDGLTLDENTCIFVQGLTYHHNVFTTR